MNALPVKFGRSYKNFRDDEFLEEVTRIDWSYLTEENLDVDTLMTSFITKITDILNVMAPVHRLSIKELKLQEKPWITRGLLISMSRRDSIYKKFLKEKNMTMMENMIALYKKYRNLIVVLLRKSKVLHFREYSREIVQTLRKLGMA